VTQLPRVDGLTHAEARLTAFVPWPAFGSLLQAFIEHIVFLTGGRQLTVRRTDAMRDGELTVSFDLTFLA
jgi:hypothetical protein